MAEDLGSSQRYTYIQLLGRGTYGAVVKCAVRDAASASGAGGGAGSSTGGPAGDEEQYVAIKAFHGAYKEKQGLKLALREARVLRVLDHPGVVKLLDAFKSPSGRPYLVLEYLPRCVATELDARPSGLSRRDVKLLSWQLASVIRYLHACRVVHRDVKPANILLTDEGVLKLCDFGFARFTSCDDPRDGEALTSYVVTRWYRAPEVLLGQEYGPPADIWSFGCTVAEMATGVPLLPGTSTADQLWRIIRMFGPLPPDMALCLAHDPLLIHMTAPPPGMALRQRLAKLGPRLLELLEVCLRPDPRDRPTAEELMHLPYFFEVPNLVLGCPQLEALYEREAAQLGIGPSLAMFPGSSTAALAAAAAAAAGAAAGAPAGSGMGFRAATGAAGAGTGLGHWPGVEPLSLEMGTAGAFGGVATASSAAVPSAGRTSAGGTGTIDAAHTSGGAAAPTLCASGASAGALGTAGGTSAVSFASNNPPSALPAIVPAGMPEARAVSGPASGGTPPAANAFVMERATAPSTIETTAAPMMPPPPYHRNTSAPDAKAAELVVVAVSAAAASAADEGPATHDQRRSRAGAGGASCVEIEVPFAPASAPMGAAEGTPAAARAAAAAAAAATAAAAGTSHAAAGLLPGERRTTGNVRRAETALPPGAERSVGAGAGGGGGGAPPERHTADSRPPAPFSSRVRRAFGAAMSGVSRRRRGLQGAEASGGDAPGSPPPPPPLEDVRTSNQTIIGYPRMSHGLRHSGTGDGQSGSVSATAAAAAGAVTVGGASAASGADCASGPYSQPSRSTVTRAATTALPSAANSLETTAAALLGAATSSQRGGGGGGLQNPGSNPASRQNTASGAAPSAAGPSTSAPAPAPAPALKPHLLRAHQQQQQQQLQLHAQSPSGKAQLQQPQKVPLHTEHPHESPRQQGAGAQGRGGSGSFLGRLCGCLGGVDTGGAAGIEDSTRGGPAGDTFSMHNSSLATLPVGTSAGRDRPSGGTHYGGDRPSGGSAAASVPFTYTASGLDDSEPYWYSEHTSANPPSQWSQHGQSQHSMIAAAEHAGKSALAAGGNSRRSALTGAIDEAGGADA